MGSFFDMREAEKMDAKLQKAIEERKKEAREKDIITKAHRIARYLGRDLSRGGDDFEYEFQNHHFFIRALVDTVHDSIGGTKYYRTEIFSHTKLVFRESGYDIDSFIPGYWEKEFGVLNDQAIQKSQEQTEMNREEREERSQRQAEADQKERQRWGL